MSTTSQIQTHSHWVPLGKTYTGTANQPDVVSIFFKSRHFPGQVKITDDEGVNSLGHYPKNFITAIPRIQKAAKVMFQEIKNGTCFKENSEFGNACKNGARGILQLVPFLGNLALFVFDQLRATLYIHPKIENELANQQEVVGIAFDGKPVFTVSTNHLKPVYHHANDLLTMLDYTWVSLKLRHHESGSRITTRELADRMRQMISN